MLAINRDLNVENIVPSTARIFNKYHTYFHYFESDAIETVEICGRNNAVFRFTNVIICPIAIPYSMGQIIKSV